jgi:RNA polymerase sigma factor (sigma-70 family)
MDEKDLVLRAQSGDMDAFDQLVLHCWDHALLFCARILHDFHAAEDILQESFAAAYLHLGDYNPQYAFKTWLYRIIRNRSISYLRKKKPLRMEDSYEAKSAESVEELFLQEELAKELHSAVDRLRTSHQQVLTLVGFEEMSYREAAKVMGKTEGQIKALLFRARKALKKQMEGGAS